MRTRAEQKILDAALTVFSRNPLATLDQVAEAAGMGRATLYRHFPGKKALMRELTLEAHQRCLGALSPIVQGAEPPLQRLEKAVETLIPLGAAFHFLAYEPWHSDDAVLERAYEAYLDQWAALLAEVQRAGHVADDLPLAWLATSLDMLLYGAWESITSGEIAPKQAAALTLRTFLRGVGT